MGEKSYRFGMLLSFERVKAEQQAIECEHGSNLLASLAQVGQFGEVLHAVHFQLQIAPSATGEAVGFRAAWTFTF